MDDELDTERQRLRARERLLELVADVERPVTLRETVTRGGFVWTLTAAPVGAPEPAAPRCPHLSPCKRDILLTLLESNHQLTGVEVRDTMERKRRLWGLCTVKMALSSLRRDGLVLNDRDQHGYGLSDAGRELARGLLPRSA